MNDNKKTLEQTVDILIEGARKTSNTFILEMAKLIKAALINNKHSEKPVSELEVLQKMPKEPSEQEIEELIAELMEATTLTIKDTKGVIADVQSRFPTAQKSTIVKIYKSLL